MLRRGKVEELLIWANNKVRLELEHKEATKAFEEFFGFPPEVTGDKIAQAFIEPSESEYALAVDLLEKVSQLTDKKTWAISRAGEWQLTWDGKETSEENQLHVNISEDALEIVYETPGGKYSISIPVE